MYEEDLDYLEDEDLDLDDDDIDALDNFMDDVLDDDDEDDYGDDDSAELFGLGRRRRRRPRRPKLRKSRTGFRRGRTSKKYATVEQVSKGFARSDKNDAALGRRITALKRDTSSYARKTNKRLKAQQDDVAGIKQMFLLTSLLSSDKKLSVKSVTDEAGRPIPGDDNIGHTFTFSDSSDSLDKLLPLMMMGGLGGKGGGMGGLGDNPMMLFLLMDSLGK